MRIAYVHLPRFPVQRRVLEQPSLAGQPLILHVDERGTQRVCFASGSAMKRGLKPGMTVAAASALEPLVVKHRFDEAAEQKALSSVGEVLMALAPGFQVDAAEGFWLDASAAHLAGSEAKWADRVLGVCRSLGLRGRCVVGSERFTTQALARWTRGASVRSSPSARPGERSHDTDTIAVVDVRGGRELARLPLEALEDGWLGDGAAAPFRALGLSTLGELTALPSGALVARFGAMGLHAARLCRGEDDSRFVADPLPEVLEETVQLDWPAEQLEPVLFALKMLIDRLSGRLQGRQQAAVRLTVTVGLEGGEPLVVPLILARPSSQARLLIELIRHRMTDLTVTQPITTLHARVDESSADDGRQLELGDAPVGEAELEVVMSRLQSALGEDALFSAQPAAQHRPEAAWTSAKFSPASSRGEGRGEAQILAAAPGPAPDTPKKWPKRKAKVEQHPEVSPSTFTARPPRLFKEPSRLNTELTDTGELKSVHLAGRRRRVESLWGPERLAGSWWSQEAFSRDYYRVQLEGVGMLWVFRDGRDGNFYAQGVFD